MNRFLQLTLASLALAAFGSSAFAQVTIDQNKALAGGVTAGDTAGFPVVIHQPGSYKLTSNLVVPSGQSGIVVVAEGVTLDLNGFAVIGAGKCVRLEANKVVTCASLQGVGIDVQGQGTFVRNGGIRGFETGLRSFGGAGAEKLQLASNGVGISAAVGAAKYPATWTDILITLSQSTGLQVQGGVYKLSGINSSRNGSIGVHINGADSVLIENSVVADNYSFGIANPSGNAKILAVRGSQVIKNSSGLAQYQVEYLTDLGGNQFQ